MEKRRLLNEKKARKKLKEQQRHEFLIKEAQDRFQSVYQRPAPTSSSSPKRMVHSQPFKCGYLVKHADEKPILDRRTACSNTKCSRISRKIDDDKSLSPRKSLQQSIRFKNTSSVSNENLPFVEQTLTRNTLKYPANYRITGSRESSRSPSRVSIKLNLNSMNKTLPGFKQVKPVEFNE